MIDRLYKEYQYVSYNLNVIDLNFKVSCYIRNTVASSLPIRYFRASQRPLINDNSLKCNKREQSNYFSANRSSNINVVELASLLKTRVNSDCIVYEAAFV